jgi:hypothetical protein
MAYVPGEEWPSNVTTGIRLLNQAILKEPVNQ